MGSAKRALAAATFVAAILTVLVGGHYYVARRLVMEPAWGEPLRTALLLTIPALGALLILQPFGERFLGSAARRLIAWPASLWMGIAFYLLVLLAVSDLLFWLLSESTAVAELVARSTAQVEGGRFVPRARATAVLALAAIACSLGLRGALRPPPLRRVEILLDRLPVALDGFRIVQLSDIHIGPILGRSFAEGLVTRVNQLRADLIAVTGDLVDGSVRRLESEVAPFSRLEARHGVFFVTGNHDYYSNADRWLAQVRKLGMRPLRNQRVTIGAGEACFDLAGVDDHQASLFGGDHGEDVPRALAGRDPSRALVLLAHDPLTFKRASALGVDLQLSGHTHGGQLWPFMYLVRAFVPFVAGLYRRNGSQLYVSRGTGFWGPPMRLGAPAEITELVLRCSSSTLSS